MDSALGEWEDLSGVRTAGEAGEEQIFSFHLTEDQMEHFAYAQLLILSEASSDVDGASDPGYARIFLLHWSRRILKWRSV